MNQEARTKNPRKLSEIQIEKGYIPDGRLMGGAGLEWVRSICESINGIAYVK